MMNNNYTQTRSRMLGLQMENQFNQLIAEGKSPDESTLKAALVVMSNMVDAGFSVHFTINKTEQHWMSLAVAESEETPALFVLLMPSVDGYVPAESVVYTNPAADPVTFKTRLYGTVEAEDTVKRLVIERSKYLTQMKNPRSILTTIKEWLINK